MVVNSNLLPIIYNFGFIIKSLSFLKYYVNFLLILSPLDRGNFAQALCNQYIKKEHIEQLIILVGLYIKVALKEDIFHAF